MFDQNKYILTHPSRGLWHCTVEGFTTVGAGNSEHNAIRDWRAQQRAKASKPETIYAIEKEVNGGWSQLVFGEGPNTDKPLVYHSEEEARAVVKNLSNGSKNKFRIVLQTVVSG